MKKYDPNAPVTNGILFNALEHVLGQMNETETSINDNMNKMEVRLTHKIEAGDSKLSKQIDELKVALADTPSRTEFDALKGKVDHLSPAN